MNFHFIHSQGGRLYIQSVTGQVLWPLLCSPKGFMPSVLKPNLIFHSSFANVGNVLSTFLHCDPSAGCLNILSCLRSSLCHHINLAFVLFMNKHFRLGIRGKYHITLAGTLFLTRIPSHRLDHLEGSYTGMRCIQGMNPNFHTHLDIGCSH